MMKFLFLAILLSACSHTDKKVETPKRKISFIVGMHLDETVWKEVKEKLMQQKDRKSVV